MTDSNEAKSELLGIPPETIAAHGAVSSETAAAVAQGALAPVDLAVWVTGVAGPGGATPTKPVGLVLFGLARRDGRCRTERCVFPRRPLDSAASAVKAALRLLDAETRR